MQTSFFEIGVNADLRPAAVGPHWAPISQNIGLHLWMRPRQTHGIPPMLMLSNANAVWIAYTMEQIDIMEKLDIILDHLSKTIL